MRNVDENQSPEEQLKHYIHTITRVMDHNPPLLDSTFGGRGQDSAPQGFSAEYDATDSIQLTGGVVFYESGDFAEYGNIEDNDRLFCKIRYSF